MVPRGRPSASYVILFFGVARNTPQGCSQGQLPAKGLSLSYFFKSNHLFAEYTDLSGSGLPLAFFTFPVVRQKR
jgi:hypothetical protein